MPTMDEIRDWKGRTLHGSDGEKLGKIDEIYLNHENDEPEWATTKTGLFGGAASFVPLRDARVQGDDIVVPVTKDKVKDAPRVEADGELSPQEEEQLYRHYEMDPQQAAQERDGVDGPPQPPQPRADIREQGRETEGHDTSGPTTDEAMTRSEEELHVGTQRREAGRARLRKYVETEHVTQTVPVQREKVAIEREPITEANAPAAGDGPAISEEEHEVVLHEEEVVTEKRVVPKERVRLGTETVTEQQQVEDDIRKERIETEGDDRPGADR